jgi:competence protein ComEC
MVVTIAYGDTRIMVTGDLEAVGERKLLEEKNVEHADVLKVGHHGSQDASSSPFLAAVAPRIAVISAGQGNRYGFPHRDTLGRLARANATVYRTDQDGAVTVVSDGKAISVETYVKE